MQGELTLACLIFQRWQVLTALELGGVTRM